MELQEAVDRAKEYARDLFVREGLVDPRLEEVEFDDQGRAWNVTIGLLRPLSAQLTGAMASQLAAIRGESEPGTRIYRVVRLRDADGAFVSAKMREEVG